MPGGRPPLYSTPEDLDAEIQKYFATPAIYTMEDLTLFLGYRSDNALSDMLKDKPEFSEPIRHAKFRCKAQRMRVLVDPDTKNINGIKFDLVNNHGMKDERNVNLGGQNDNKLEISVVYTKSKEANDETSVS